jgi:predicted short-subunit dehydrogenase-like oxidoreductase (DUF2520 family)
MTILWMQVIDSILMNIVFLGSGNTATVLATHMQACGHSIMQVWSRRLEHALELAQKVNAEVITDLSAINKAADICMLAVSDDAMLQVASQLSLQKKILVHTAGSVSMDVLKGSSPNYGVVYPLQSLQKEMEAIPEIPFLIDGNSDDVKVLLADFARTLSASVSLANDEQRLNFHLSAVIVNNFTNHLYTLAEDFCKQQTLDFSLLQPLIKETPLRIRAASPSILQTGPAKRNDVQTIQKHLQLLKDDEALQKIYQNFTDSITTYYKNKELRDS